MVFYITFHLVAAESGVLKQMEYEILLYIIILF